MTIKPINPIDSSSHSNHHHINKRRVCFASNATVKRSLHVNDYSTEEIRTVWYSKEEMDRMRNEISLTLHFMENKEHQDDCRGNDHNDSGEYGNDDNGDNDESDGTNRLCTRGLEFRTKEGSMRRRHNKHLAITAVLDEQRRQQNTNHDVLDSEEISAAYKDVSFPCQMAALKMGRLDAEDVRSVVSDRRIKNTIAVPRPTFTPPRNKKSESTTTSLECPHCPDASLEEPFSVRRVSRAA